MTRPFPFLTEPQWHQGHSPRLCPLWLQGQCRRSFSPPGSPSPCPDHYILALGYYAASASFPHVGIFTSSGEATWERSSPVPGHTTYRDPRSCRLSTGCRWNNVPNGSPLGTRHHPMLGQVYQPLSPVRFHGLSSQVPCVGLGIRSGRSTRLRFESPTVVPGLPTLTSATAERRPGRPYTVVHV